MRATNFDEYVAAIASESPHAAVLDWGRRLELSVAHYLGARGVSKPDSKKLAQLLSGDPQIGPVMARTIKELRDQRNTVAHEQVQVTEADAKSFARSAFDAMSVLLIAAKPFDAA